MSRIAIVGPGSVGVYFGAHLAAAGHEVVACARRAFTDYRVDSPTDPVAGPATVVTDPSQLDGRPFDWVLVGVKAHQTAGAADWISATCGPGAVAVVLQNGVEGVERVQPFVTGATILNSVVYCGAELLTPGHINHQSAGFLWLPDCPDAHRLADLSAPSVSFRPTSTFQTELWRKLGINAAFNGITALTLRNISVVADPPVQALARAVLSEAWTIAREEGAELTDADVDSFLAGAVKIPQGSKTSMLQDRVAGRPTEWDALQGAVVRFGVKHGVATPYTTTLATLLEAGDRRVDTPR